MSGYGRVNRVSEIFSIKVAQTDRQTDRQTHIHIDTSTDNKDRL